jgi:ubiquinone/menaquinone biosynthesis C-methylase UbiE
MDLRGFVDFFDGEQLRGWAFDAGDPARTLEVDLFLDDLRVASVQANRLRPDLEAVSPDNLDKGFVHLFAPPLCSSRATLLLPELPKITVKFAGTDRHLLVIPELLGIVNVDHLNVAEGICIHADNRFLPTPPQSMLEHVAGEGATPFAYRAVGMFLVLDLLQLGLITNTECTVADVGCGSGRLATQLAPYLAESGTYHGFDTWAAGVRWAGEHLTPLYPRFQFRQMADAGDKGRDPGYVGRTAYPIPLPDASCDLVVASSVLTHLTHAAARDYLAEFRRVLKPQGRAYVTFFLYDQEAERLLAGKTLRHDEHGAYYQHANFFDTYFREPAVAAMVAEVGLHPAITRYGTWRGERYSRRKPVGYQDLLVLRRA